MENIKGNLIIWLDMLKALTEFDYQIISSTDNRIIVKIDIDNNKYMIEAYKA